MKTVLFLILNLAGEVSHSQSDEQYPGCLDSLYIPKSFTPNGDSGTDSFAVFFPCMPDKFTVAVYSRWGTEIYSSKYPGFQWDGKTTEGEEVESGTYFYRITFIYLKEEKEITGNVTLIR
jgi:gliding motility-associated-like protein